MNKNLASNTFLTLGVFLLIGFGVVELVGSTANPLIPATSALCIGCTAVLDRVSLHRLNK